MIYAYFHFSLKILLMLGTNLRWFQWHLFFEVHLTPLDYSSAPNYS